MRPSGETGLAPGDVERIVSLLVRWGLLLESDQTLPSVASLIAGEPVHGSWWGHPRGGAIYVAGESLTGHEDVLRTKLVSGKVTYVHRSLWRDVLAVATARERWQTDGVDSETLALLDLVEEHGRIRLDELPRSRDVRQAARELEARLLVHTDSVHTHRGAHVLRLESWQCWAQRAGIEPPFPTAADARATLEEVLGRLNAEFSGRALLPWQRGGGPVRHKPRAAARRS